MSRILFFSLLFTVTFSLLGTASSEQETVKGVIVDQSGAPIAAATVFIKGTDRGVITNEDGSFSIRAQSGEILEAEFFGYKPASVTIGGGESFVTITLQQDAIEVEDIVVTALGIKRNQKALGYAVTEVKGDDLVSANTISPVAALQGRAAGVSISGSDGGVFGGSKIQIRGVSTLSGNNQPIFVVDGVILANDAFNSGEYSDYATKDYGNQLKNLNADDFESVSVLKGAAATALYGSRGINGAVVVTTKSGNSKTKGLGISVSQTTGVDWVYRTPKFQNEYGPGTIAGDVNYGEVDARNGSYYKFDTNQFYTENVNGVQTPSLRSSSAMSWGPRFDGRQVIGYDGLMTEYKSYKRNMKDAYEVGVNTNTNITVQGASDKGSFYLSDSYNYRKGTFPGNNFERNSLLFKSNYNISESISIDASVNFTQSNSKNPPYSLGSKFWNGTYGRGYNVDYYKDKYQTSHGGVPSTNFGDQYGTVPGMDLWFNLNNNNSSKKETMVIPIVKLNVKAADWMTLSGELNMNYYNSKLDNRQLGQGYQNEGGMYELALNEQIQRSAKVNANFNKTFGDFTTSLIVGGEWYSNRSTFMSQETSGGLVVPGQFFIENSINLPKYSSRINNTKNIYSLYYLASASWKEMLFLDVTGRNDWSSSLVYADGVGDNSYFYPSVSTSWLISETFNLPHWVSFAKVRASWAQVGNDTDPYRINGGYNIERVQLASGIGYLNTFTRELIDPNLRPERKNSVEFGLDFRILKNRLGFDLTWYKENTKDQIVSIPAPFESGVNTQLINAGNIENKGIELSINTTPIKNGKVRWDLNLIYTRNRNKIISLHPDVGLYKQLEGSPTYGNMRIGSAAYIGGEYGALLSDSKPKTYKSSDPNDPRNGMQVLTWDEGFLGAYPQRSYTVEQIGSIFPKFEGSIYNSLTIGNFDMNVLVDMRFGGNMASISSKFGNAYGMMSESLWGRDAAHGGITYTSGHAEKNYGTYSDGIIPEGVFDSGTNVKTAGGSTVDVGGMTYKQAYEAGYVEPTHSSYYQYRTNAFSTGVVNDSWFAEVKYIALRQISIGYTMPKNISAKLRMTNMRLSLDAHNVCYLYNSLPNKINPESFSGNTSAGSYFEQNLSPYTATYSLTIKFNM